MSTILVIITVAGFLSGLSILLMLMRRRDHHFRDFMKRRDSAS